MNVLQVHTTSVYMTYPMSWHLPSNLKTIERLQLVTIKLDYWEIRFFELAKQMYTSFLLVTCHTCFDSGIFFFLYFILKPGTVL